MKFRWQARVVLVLPFAIATIAWAQFSTSTPGLAQETQAHGYWVNPSTGLLWAGKDNGKRVSWHKARNYCRNLRLTGYSDWRMATIDELEGLVNLRAYATQRVGSIDYLHWNSHLQVNGGLLLTGDRQWSSTPLIDVHGRPSKAAFWYFDYRRGSRERGFEDIAEGDHMQALCVRESKSAPAPPSNGAMKAVTPSPTGNQDSAQEARSPAHWTDPSTGLMWIAKDNGKNVNLGEAMNYCRDLRVARYSDWRLATIDELEGIHGSKRDDRPLTHRVMEELTLTGDPWSVSIVNEDRGLPPVFVWYLSSKSGTRVFDQPGYDQGKRGLCVRNSVPPGSSTVASVNVRSLSADQGSAQETQQRGYWIDPSTGLMWAGRDNLGNFILYSEATKYCRDLRLARYSDWRLATIEELQGIYDQDAESPGASPRSYRDQPEPLVFHVKGGLFLTGIQWASTGKSDSGSPSDYVLVFDFKDGKLVNDKRNSIREKRALCVRRPSK